MRVWRLLRLFWIAFFLVLLLWLYAIPADSRSGGAFDLAPWLRKAILALQFTPALAAGLGVVAVLTIAALVLSSLLFGRVFCSLLCPTGMVQEWAHRLGIYLKTSRLRFKRPPRRILIWMLIGICGLWGVAAHYGTALASDMTDPVGLFGRAAAVLGEIGRRLVLREESFSLAAAMLTAAAFVVLLLILLPLVGGRWFCDRLCPAGAVLGLFANHARRRGALDAATCTTCGRCENVCPMRCIDSQGKSLDFSRCVLCFECMWVCPNNAVRYAAGDPVAVPDAQTDPARRTFLLSLGAWSAGAFYLASRTLGEYRLTSTELAIVQLEAPMPPGAHDWQRYRQRCVGCWSCVQACPEGILQPSPVWRTPLMDFRRGFCQYSCTKCTQACPSRAITPLTTEEKKVVRVGMSAISLSRCVAVVDGEACGACAELCPTYALTMRQQTDGRPSLPDFDPRYCIGCGACRVACPVDAFVITPLSRQETSDGVRDTGPSPMEIESPDADGLYDFPI